MYPLSPPSIHVLDRALADANSAARVARMLTALGTSLDAVEHVTDADIPALIHRQNWVRSRERQGRLGPHTSPALVFGTLRFDETPPTAPVLAACPPGTSPWLVGSLLGQGGQVLAREHYSSGRGVCRARVQYDTIFGCPHGCRYCPGGEVAVVMTNLEELLDRQIRPAVETERWQKTFMFNSSLSDTPCFEPEYGLSQLLVEFFAETTDQCYLIHTKSANTDFLTQLDHRGHTVVLWSLSSESSSRLVEPGTATATERIEAARRCQAAGYPIRFKLKPVVPLKGWRKEYREVIARLFARTRPESVGMFMCSWMDADEFEACFDPDWLEPRFLDALRDSAVALKGVNSGPFPHEARAEVYNFLIDEVRRHDQDVPLFLCTETTEMWRELGPKLGVDPAHYVCGCGPQCRPGLTRLEQVLLPTELRAAGV